MLQVTTEVGKSGKTERERRHYPGLHNEASTPRYQTQGRRYHAHGYGDEEAWQPHGCYQEPKYTESGPDWNSRLRHLPHPENPNYPAPENFPVKWYSTRFYPWTYFTTDKEWNLHPSIRPSKVGRRCVFDGVHCATARSHRELEDKTRLGKSRNEWDIDFRNGLRFVSLGDKNYQASEYTPGFHKEGSTLPVANFSGSSKPKYDTFIPLQRMPLLPRPRFSAVDKVRQRDADVQLVKKLDTWKPATPLHEKLFT